MAALRDRVASSAMRTRNLTKRRACSALKGRRTRPFSGRRPPVLERVQEHEQGVSRPDAQPRETVAGPLPLAIVRENRRIDRKSTRLNSSHGYISYAVFCLKKKKHLISLIVMICC